MKIKEIKLFATLLMCSSLVYAESDLAPVILVTPDSAGVRGDGYGIVGSVIEMSSDKRTARRIQGFKDAAKGVDWTSLARAEFACIGVATGSTCRSTVHFADAKSDLAKIIREAGSSRGLVVELVLMHEPSYYRARATVREVEVVGSNFKVLRQFTAVYFTFAPKSIVEQSKKSFEKLIQYWQEGEEPLLNKEAKASISNLKSMLDALYQAAPQNKAPPQGWDALTPVKDLVVAGKVSCGGGTGCSAARVYADRGDRVWLTMKSANVKYGWPMVSLNWDTALQDANVIFYLTTHEL